MWSQVGLRKHHYEQSQWRWWNSSWAISNPKRRCYDKVLRSICQQIGKLSSGHRTGKGQFSFQSQRKAMPKNVQPTTQLHSSHTLAKSCWKFSKTEFNSGWTKNFQMFKLDLEKAEEPEIKLPTPVGSYKKQESSRKTSNSASLTTLKPLTVWITTNCGKFFKRWEYQTTCPAFWETCMQVKKQQLELNMEQWTGSKLGKEHIKAVYCHPAYLTYMQSTSCEMPGWMKHKLESRLPGEISITSDMQMTPPLWQETKN